MTNTPIYPTKPWTFLVYIAGDNDLDPSARFDLQEMRWGASGEHVHAVAQFDSRDDAAYRYRFVDGQQEQVGDPLPEINSGDAATLTDFVRWGRRHFPGERTALVIWSHGTGLRELPEDFDYASLRSGEAEQTKVELRRTLFHSTLHTLARQRGQLRGIAVDATARDFLDTRELARALAAAQADGPPVDLLGFDACLMNVLEIAYQLRNQARFMAGSQEQMPGQGWPYADLLTLLEEEPGMDGASLACWIVDLYTHATGGDLRGRESPYTHSAMDLSRVTETHALIQALAKALLNPEVLEHSLVQHAFHVIGQEAKRFHERDLVDLGDWCALLGLHTPGAASHSFGERLAALQRHLAVGEGVVLASRAHGGDDAEAVHGVSIYWPREEYDPLYDRLDFADTQWGTLAQHVINQQRF